MQLICVPGVALPACDVSAHLPPHFRRVLPEFHGAAPLHLGECPVRGRASGRLLQVLREGVHLQPAAVSHLSAIRIFPVCRYCSNQIILSPIGSTLPHNNPSLHQITRVI
jgi:hypothetical protein